MAELSEVKEGRFRMSSSPASTHPPVSRSALSVLASHFNSDGCDVRLLRLRLRFGSPRAVSSGVAFRIVVDLVDEMAQPPPSKLASTLKVVMDANLKLEAACAGGYELVSCHKVASGSSSLLQWRFDCVVTVRPALATTVPGVRLHIYCSPSHAPTSLTASHALLQSFCVGSRWICTEDPRSHVLVLPVVSDTIQVMPPDVFNSLSAQAKSSLCLRQFAIPPTSVSAPLEIEEDYGEAMGSHIWAASIWLSLALIASSHNRPGEKEAIASVLTILELGTGCGLFAVVFAQLARIYWQPFQMILTEKGNSISRITENLARNNVVKDQEAVVRELMWGTSTTDVVPDGTRLDVVFAADVLYHWSAHEALLATLEGLVPIDSKAPVLIAHKHRGQATTTRLEGVLSQGHDVQCELIQTDSHASKCRWSRWHVERIARIANIDVLQLTRKKN